VTAYRDYDDTALMRFLRIVSKSFPIGDFFGVHVRMYWAAAILMPLLFLRWIGEGAGSGGEALLLSLSCSALLHAVVYTHEMGHIAAGWRFRIRTDLITLSPLGGVAHMNAPAPGPRQELLISLAGPAVHLLWLAVFWPLHLLLPDRVLQIDGWSWCPVEFTVWFLVTTNQSLFLFNLVPFFPLDGGRCLRALLAMRWHPNRATMWATAVGIAGGGVMLGVSLTQARLESTIPFVIGLSCILASLQERRIARHMLIYGHTIRDPWESDPDAWKRAAGPPAGPPRRPGALARWWQERAQRRARARHESEQALDREVDEILERVHKVGMTGLSEREKAVLKRASQRRRGAG
jgi:Zn-dependent protease